MTLLVDNYDSFSYNLFQLVGSMDPEIKVIRNDAMTIPEIEVLSPDRIILSPGPGRPADAGICGDLVRAFAGKIPILGVCLGHQVICEVYGATVTYAKQLMHGKQSNAILDKSCPLFASLPDPRGPLPFPCRRSGDDPALPARHCHHEGAGDHGCAAHRSSRIRRPVPSRIHPHSGR